MPDHIDRYTDQQEAAYAKKIAATYKQAAQEVRRQITEFAAKHKAKAAKLLQQVNAGEISMADYQAWLQGQVFIGKQWQDKLDDIVRVYTDADEKARQLMRGTVRDVFTESANYAAYQLEGRLGAAVDFHLYDAKTVDLLMRTNPQMLPEWKINEKKDYTWNEERVRSTLTRAIIQGKPIPDIADELGQQLATSNGDKMVLFARTAMTGAQNAGRIERLHDTQQMGIRVKKKWLAAHDARVRDTHAYLDGQERDVDEDFEVGGMHIAYPGDPLAPPELVYNCRCTMIYVYPEHQAEHVGEKTESYEEWLEEKRGKKENTTEEPKKEDKVRVYGGNAVDGIADEQHRAAVIQRLESAPDFVRGAWEASADSMDAPLFDARRKNGQDQAYFSPSDGKTHYTNESKCFGQSSYQEEYAVYFHEYGHNIDYLLASEQGRYLSDEYMGGAFGKTIREEIEGHVLDYYRSQHPDLSLAFQTQAEKELSIAQSFIETPGVRRDIRIALQRLEHDGAIDSADELFERLMAAKSSGDFGLVRSIYQDHLAADPRVSYVWRHTARHYIDPAIRQVMTPSTIRDFCETVNQAFSVYQRSDISDMFDGYFSQYGVEYGMGVGHGKKYFSSKSALAHEAFAEMFSATTTDNQSLAMIRQFFPKSYEIFCDMIRSALR